MLDTFSPSIQQLINDIIHCHGMSNKKLQDILADKNFSGDIFREYETFDHPVCHSYGRRLIYDHGTFKILLMSWAPGDFTAIHNHGYTEWGAVCFYGEATHRIYKNEGSQLNIVQSEVIPGNSFAPVCGDLIHIMGNDGKNGFTTLHIYGSNSRESHISQDASIFLPEHEMIVTTMGSAYLEPEQNKIRTRRPFQCDNQQLLEDYYHLVQPFYRRNKRISILEKLEAFLSA